MPQIRIEQLAKAFPASGRDFIRAVDGLNLAVDDAELLTLVGPSGCGKTTTLRLIAGLEIPASGKIFIGGRDVTQVPPEARDIAMVFQNHALYPHMTARENLAFGLKIRKVPAAESEKRIKEIVELMGIGDCLSRRPAELSGGQRQRVALGRALVRRPGLLLLDEPFAQLDAPLRRELCRELLRLHRELTLTTIFVTHDQIEAMALGRRVAVMNRGTIEQIATPDILKTQPANAFISSFLDASPL